MTKSEIEFTAGILLDTISASPRQHEISVPREALPQVAKRLQIPDVNSLSAKFEVRREDKDVIVTGQIEGSLVRACVVSLEAFVEPLLDKFSLRLVERLDEEDEPRDGEDVDLIAGDAIDLAEILVQQAALSMSAYPRKPGAFAPQYETGDENAGPFSALKGLVDGGS